MADKTSTQPSVAAHEKRRPSTSACSGARTHTQSVDKVNPVPPQQPESHQAGASPKIWTVNPPPHNSVTPSLGSSRDAHVPSSDLSDE